MSVILSDKMRSEKENTGKPFRVLVVDDSAIIRGLISRWLEEDDEIIVVGTAGNGRIALRSLRSTAAEVVVLDIEMPEMDGMTVLPKMIEQDPDIKIIMASTLTERNAEISLKALAAGASDYIPKPESRRAVTTGVDFKRELLQKVKALAAARRRDRGEKLPGNRAYGAVKKAKRPTGDAQLEVVKTDASLPGGSIKLIPPSKSSPRVLAVGASTGGPQALTTFLADLKHFLNIPVVITQHMPPTFTTIMAEHLGRACGKPTKEAEEGDVLQRGHIYVAPGDHHLVLERREGEVIAHITKDPPENFCRPSVDPMFRSVAEVYGSGALCAVLTGMGHDGTEGARKIIDAGGSIIAQDEKTSVVWGMPGSVATAGLCTAVLPLDEMGAATGRLIMGGVP